jgi:hypothetical protein
MGGGGSPASASTGGNPNAYIPQNQPAFDQAYQGILNSMNNASVAGSTPGQINWPYAETAAMNVANNPYLNQAISGGVNAAGQGGPLGSSLYGYGSSILPQAASNPYVQQALQGAQQGANYGAGGAAQLYGGANQLMGTGFDPQNALYNRTLQQTNDAANAANASAGIGSTPYGASVVGNTDANFNINWQNQQLARQNTALQGAGAAYGAAPGLAASSAALPSNVYTGNIANMLSGLASAGSLANLGINTGYQASQLPYSTSTSAANNTLGALGTANTVGNQQYDIPQNILNNIQSYLGLGQSATGLGFQGGQMGFNQLAGGIGGGLAGLNTLGGANGIFPGAFSSAASGIGGLLGGAGGAGAAAAAPAAAGIMGLGGGATVDALTTAVMLAAL